jgi:hypothetical protein
MRDCWRVLNMVHALQELAAARAEAAKLLERALHSEGLADRVRAPAVFDAGGQGLLFSLVDLLTAPHQGGLLGHVLQAVAEMVAAQEGNKALAQEATSLGQEVTVLEQVGAPSRLWQCLILNVCRMPAGHHVQSWIPRICRPL